MRVKLEDVCERGSSNVKQSDIPKNEGLYEIYGASGFAGKVNFYHRSEPYVAVVKDGAGIGRTMFLPGKTSVIGTLQYLIPKDNILPKYLYYVVRYMNLSKYFTGATIPHIYYRDYKNEEFNLSSIDDQKTIINRLEALEHIIESRTDELKKLDNLIKARFVEMFGDGFETTELRNICKTTSGGTPSTKNPDYYNGTIPWVTTTALGPNHINGTKAKAYISEEAVANSATKIIPSGSILFGIRVGVGKTSINDVDICTNQDIVAIMDVNETKFSKLFIKHVLDANRAHYDSLKKGATILGITSDDLKNTLIPLAPIKAQKDFETFVEQVDKSKFALGNELTMGNFYVRLIYDRIVHGCIDLRMAQ